ncbi:MAG: DNA-directed RNA polymerase subunit omega [Bacteroidota bacterium]|nr:DNA-directed RNA polymerase subunit omega [Bacteroidota bacterium]MDP4191857.1 DNA-directed RNA polymerase subunit omega [Bacteroidota bacterium]MDP4195456.1 DNA-directed RNA polymerase subunit omega [Bacteroidota bacterium]
MQIQPVDLRKIDEQASNVYEAIIVSAKEARRINEEQRLEYNLQVNTIPSKGLEDDSEDMDNPDQLKVSLEFEKRPKPHLQALNELLDGKIEFRYKTKDTNER